MNPLGRTEKYLLPFRTIKISTRKKHLESNIHPVLGTETNAAVARSAIRQA